MIRVNSAGVAERVMARTTARSSGSLGFKARASGAMRRGMRRGIKYGAAGGVGLGAGTIMMRNHYARGTLTTQNRGIRQY